MHLRRLNPFAGLPNPKEVWAWGMYDLAHQSFTLLITTIFYAIYFKKVVVVNDEARGAELWGYAFGITSVIIVIVSPLAGALADFSGRKKTFLVALGVVCVAFTCALAFTGPGTVALAITLYVIANTAYMLGDNFVAAFLPEISTRQTVGRVSALGWTMGYFGALVCMPAAALILWLMGATDAAMKTIFVFAGLWFLLAMIPTIVIIKEKKQPEPLPAGSSLLTIGFSRLWQTSKEVRHFRQIAAFFAVFLVYSCGVQTFIVFAGVLAEQYVQGQTLMLLIWALAAVSGVAAFAAGAVQDRIGHRATVVISLCVWLLTALGAAALPVSTGGTQGPPWYLWPVGIGIGIGLGAIGTSSRALVGVMTPTPKTAEFFGLWGLSLKGAGAIGPPIYGFAAHALGQQRALLLIAGFFMLGLVGMAFVNPAAGRKAAEAYEAAR